MEHILEESRFVAVLALYGVAATKSDRKTRKLPRGGNGIPFDLEIGGRFWHKVYMNSRLGGTLIT